MKKNHTYHSKITSSSLVVLTWGFKYVSLPFNEFNARAMFASYVVLLHAVKMDPKNNNVNGGTSFNSSDCINAFNVMKAFDKHHLRSFLQNFNQVRHLLLNLKVNDRGSAFFQKWPGF